MCMDQEKEGRDWRSLLQRQIEALTLEYYNRVAADIWTMSPPCQPYTRVGLQQGSQDARSRSFLYLLDVLKQMVHRPKYILVENVKGFEVSHLVLPISSCMHARLNHDVIQESDSRDMLVETLEDCGYIFQEFLLTPLQLGIPNSRMRYYLLVNWCNTDMMEQMLILLSLGKARTKQFCISPNRHHTWLYTWIRKDVKRVYRQSQ